MKTIGLKQTRKINKEQANEIKEIRKMKNLKSYKDLGYYSKYLPTVISGKVERLSGNALKSYVIDRIKKHYSKKLQEANKRIDTVFNAPDVISGSITIEWRKSRMWGSNPTAVMEVRTSDGYMVFNSGSISGCGYDKESTAVAEVLNQCNGILKEMYKVKEKHPRTDNRKLFGYGSGYGFLPYFEGGVGTNVYYRIFDKIGFKFEKTASGKTFDVYTFSKE